MDIILVLVVLTLLWAWVKVWWKLMWCSVDFPQLFSLVMALLSCGVTWHCWQCKKSTCIVFYFMLSLKLRFVASTNYMLCKRGKCVGYSTKIPKEFRNICNFPWAWKKQFLGDAWLRWVSLLKPKVFSPVTFKKKDKLGCEIACLEYRTRTWLCKQTMLKWHAIASVEKSFFCLLSLHIFSELAAQGKCVRVAARISLFLSTVPAFYAKAGTHLPSLTQKNLFCTMMDELCIGDHLITVTSSIFRQAAHF